MPNPIKTSPEFNRLYDVLNVAQKKAVDTVEGPVVVIAGPGTGKTTVLTLRIANILRKTDTAPENILALTFTESGAYVMRRKLVEIIGAAAYKVNIQTFHGFAEKIIQEYPDYFSRIIGSQIITDAEQIKIVEQLIQSRDIKVLRPYGDPGYYIKSVLNEIHLLKRENISPKDFSKSIENDRKNANVVIPAKAGIQDGTNKLNFSGNILDSRFRGNDTGRELSAVEIEKLEKRNEKNSELALVYERYEEELAKKKFYDFDDMLLELIRAMESDEMLKLTLQETYQYILADEHQDANASQNRILELLADFHDSPNLFIVGDDKQAIYRFQGASLENFLYFSKKYKDAVVIELTHNYRSHQGILDASHSLIENNPVIPGYIRPKLISLQVGSKPIFVDEFVTRNEELYCLAVLIEKLIKKGEKPEEIAVLYRENREAKNIAEALRSQGVICRIESDHNILDDVDSAKVVIICRSIHDLSNSNYLGQVLLLSELGCNPASVSEIFNLARRENIALYKMIEELSAGSKWIELRKQIGPEKLKAIKLAYGNLVRWSAESQTMSFPDFLQKLIQETNLLASIVVAPNSLERLSSLETLFDRIVKAAKSKETFRLSDFIEYINIISNHGILAKQTHSDHIGGVRLMTAHRSKGLEFNHVFLVNAVDGIWGNRTRRNHFTIPIIEHARDTGRVEDERRLFYVAMTRARESINIFFARRNEEKEVIPSQFISEIDPSLVSFNKPIMTDHPELFTKKMQTPHATPSVSILSKDFIHSKFFSQPFSVTHLNSYLRCPWQYFFVNLIRIPQAQNKHQMYGTAIHSALRTFFEAYKAERDFPKKELIEVFKYNLSNQAMSATDRTESLEKGKEALGGYFDAYNGTWNRSLLTEYAIKAVELPIDIDNDSDTKKSSKIDKTKTKTKSKNSDLVKNSAILYLTGKLDKVEFFDTKNVNVIDFKTSKPKSRNDIEGKTKTSDGNYKRQLVFYKLLLSGDKKFDMQCGEIDFIEPNERGKYKKERFEISDLEVTELKKLIEKVAKEIVSLSFIDSVCDDKDCEYCRLGKILI